MSGAAAAPGPHPDDLLPAYALGSLEADEIQAVERHLATCPQCAAEVDRLRRTVDLLPLAATPVPPPQGSREALFSRIRRDRLRHDRLRRAQALAGLDPGSSRLVSLQGADAAPQAEGVVVYDPRGRTAVVVLDNLPPLAPGQVYQLWLLRPDAPPTSAGTLAPDAVGTSGAVVRAGNELGLYNGAAVTLEPAPGQAAPSGPFVVRTSL